MQTYIARSDGIRGESCHHNDTLGEIDGVMSCIEEVRMDMYWRHLEHTHGIREDRLCLTVFITSGIDFECRCFGPFGIIILKETNEKLHGVVTSELDRSANDAGGVAIQDQCLKTDELWSETIDTRILTTLKENGTLLEDDSSCMSL